MHERYEDTENLLATIAATNRRKVPPSGVLRAALTRIAHQVTGTLITACLQQTVCDR